MLPERYLNALIGLKRTRRRTRTFQHVGLTLSYIVFSLMGLLGLLQAHAAVLMGLLAVALAQTLMTAAATVCLERKAGTWPGLLTMPLSDWQLLGIKAEYVLRRCRVAWVLMGIFLVAFVLLGQVHPAGAVGIAMMSVCSGAFAFSLGAFMSARLANPGTAVGCSFAIAFAGWVAMPLLVGLALSIDSSASWTGPLRDWGNRIWLASPLTHVWLSTVNSPSLLSAMARRGSSNQPYFLYVATMPSAWTSLVHSCVVCAAYAILALLFGQRAIRHFRT